MSVTFYNFNLAQFANLTASSENLLFPASNLQDYRRTKVFRSTVSSANIIFDMLTTEDVDSFIVVENPNATFGFNTLTLEANATANFSSPAFSVAINTVDFEHGVGIKEFATQSYRYWRLVAVGASYVELSNVFIGKKNELSTVSVDYGWKFEDEDISTISTNRYGQQFADIIGSKKDKNLPFRTFNKDELDQVFQMYDLNGKTMPLFIKISTGANQLLNNENRFAGMYYLSKRPELTNKSFGFYDFNLDLKEAK